MAQIDLQIGDPILYEHYGYYTPGIGQNIPVSLLDTPQYQIDTPPGFTDLTYGKSLSVTSGVQRTLPSKYRVIEALYITQSSYTPYLIYPGNNIESVTYTVIGSVKVNSFKILRSRVLQTFDPQIIPTIKPIIQTPLSGSRSSSNELPIGWELAQAPIDYRPIVADKILFTVLNPTGNVYTTEIKHWQLAPYQVEFALPQGTVFDLFEIPTIIEEINKPIYIDLLSGYSEDSRTVSSKPIIEMNESRSVIVSYYRENKDEPIPRLRSIDWMTYYINLKAGLNTLPIIDCVLGTLTVSDSLIKSKITQLPDINQKYPYKYYFLENLAELFNHWYQIAEITLPVAQGNLRLIGANNNHWNNRPNPSPDVNYDINHELFRVDSQRDYDWHIKPQLDGSYGDLVMNSPKLEEVHAALNAGSYLLETPAIIGTGTIDNPQTPAQHKLDWYIKNSAGEKVTAIWKALGGNKYGTNEIDNTKSRVTNLGFLVERIAKVLGIRLNDNGEIDIDNEKKIVRQVVKADTKIDDTKIGVNCIGDEGIVVKRINNRFDKQQGVVSDQCVILQDIPQMIQEYFEQSNLALGFQESSAIEINQGKTKARYNNQLELLVELVNLASSGNEMIRSALVSSLISQSQTNEIIAGIGLPSVTKTIPIKIDKKVHQLPYKGIAAHRSLSQEIATCTYNVGIATGQLL